ncbi:hypothetical protein NSERKGN1266_30720 [Nocardia seriolae]|nr:hypothetical protein NSERKGN1266_30720 [Nocardia seriolae]GEM27817.1 hypothetical protein NS2_60560 [Nocardia seriolae NBRC 15557]
MYSGKSLALPSCPCTATISPRAPPSGSYTRPVAVSPSTVRLTGRMLTPSPGALETAGAATTVAAIIPATAPTTRNPRHRPRTFGIVARGRDP